MFERLVPLIGKTGLERLSRSRVLVVGTGGVGAHAVEALARSGIGHLVLVDGDRVRESDLNRQLPALRSTLSKMKVEVLKARIVDINPDCDVHAYPFFYDDDTKSLVWTTTYDFVVEAVDDIKKKLDIILTCKDRKIPFVTVCGQGRRMIPEKVTMVELSESSGDPLAKRLRAELRRHGKLENTPAVFSAEPPMAGGEGFVASSAFVPAVAGLVAAGYVVRKLLED